jgi:predicted O-methyltransferase YrrM
MKFDLVLLMPIRKTILIILISFFQKNKGGIILSDNVLWSGKVLEPLQHAISTKYYWYNALLKNWGRNRFITD